MIENGVYCVGKRNSVAVDHDIVADFDQPIDLHASIDAVPDQISSDSVARNRARQIGRSDVDAWLERVMDEIVEHGVAVRIRADSNAAATVSRSRVVGVMNVTMADRVVQRHVGQMHADSVVRDLR